MQAKRLFDFLDIQVDKNPDRVFLSSKVKGKWKDYSFRQAQELANRVTAFLLGLGLHKGDKIALVSNNRPEWNFVDIGAMQAGIVVVPVYPNISEKDYEYIFNDAEIQFALISDEKIYRQLRLLPAKIESLKNIFSFDDFKDVLWMYDFLPERIDAGEILNHKNSILPDDLATIIYTSGTTGNPKGVMLTHKNIVSNVLAVKEVTPFGEGEKALSFLPLCHSFERMVFYAYLCFGIHISYAESLETIAENIQEVRPYCFTTVPRMLEKVYAKILQKAESLSGFRQAVFKWAMNVGGRYKTGAQKNLLYSMELALARRMVFKKWKTALGDNVHFIITGAAAMQPRLITLFTAAGIPVLEGYGLTETSPVLCCNRVEESERCTGTVGLPVPGVTIELADDGEIIARGPNIMKGYYKQPQLTGEVIDANGWFHTGDIGEWVKCQGKQFLKITDRKKELFKTAGGKYVAPQVIENKLKESRFIEQVMIVGGDDKKFVSALIVPVFSQLTAWQKENGYAVQSPVEMLHDPKILQLIHGEIKTYNDFFGSWEQVKKFVLLKEEWSVESGELTPTMKPKRKIISQRYAAEIESMYAGSFPQPA